VDHWAGRDDELERLLGVQTADRSGVPMPVTVLTGFLGAGKTTLVNRILSEEHGLRIAVLVNDFGEIDVDGELIVGVAAQKVSLANGCVCCEVRDDLLAVIGAILLSEAEIDAIVLALARPGVFPVGRGHDVEVTEFDFRDNGGVVYDQNGSGSSTGSARTPRTAHRPTGWTGTGARWSGPGTVARRCWTPSTPRT